MTIIKIRMFVPSIFQGLENAPRFFPSLGKTAINFFQALENSGRALSNLWNTNARPPKPVR
jgi:hypothetical protein